MMGGWRCVLILVLGLLGTATPVRAGIYFTDEPAGLPLPTNFREVTFRLLDLRSIPADKVQEQTPIRAHYQDLLKRLQEKEKQGLLLFADRINLGACYLRMSLPGRPHYWEARRVLEEAERLADPNHPHRFLMLANLAVTYHGLAETEAQPRYFDQAIAYQRQALRAWPELHPGWNTWQNQSLRRAEVYYQRLLECRRTEIHKQPDPVRFKWQQVDDLFGGVTFTGPGGEYQAGRIAPEMWDRLPIDAPNLALQLLFWFPYDDRLYWLYGEVLNAHNQVVPAASIFNDLVQKRNHASIRELKEHRWILEEAATAQLRLQEQLTLNPLLALQVLVVAAPRGGTLGLGVAGAALEAVWPVIGALHTPTPEPEPVPEPPDVRRPIDWQPLFVGFGAGTLFGVLFLLQIRQWRRRQGDSIRERRLQES